MIAGRRPTRPRRRALTLIEVLLVLCLLVIVGALTWPVVLGAFEAQRLRAAADAVRGQLLRARTEAVRSGRVYAFTFVPGGSTHRVAPADIGSLTLSGDASLDADALLQLGDATDADAALVVEQEALPDDVLFSLEIDAETAMSLTTDATLSDPMPLGATAGATSPGGAGRTMLTSSEPARSLLFYPDGTTSRACIRLETIRGRMIELSVRGLTGVVTVSDIGATEALP